MATSAASLHPPTRYLALGAVGLSLAMGFRYLQLRNEKISPIKSPRDTLLPKLQHDEIATLPYPPDVLPGSRDVETPYGTIKVFEWGPEDGERVLLLHGISTPCLSLANMAEELVAQGYRVALFDFFGRGYSDAPTDVPYDIRLYTTQILLVLASSSVPWTGDNGFHLVGYSLGGGLAVPFAKYFPHMVKSLVLIAGGGLIRPEHVSLQSKILYSTGLCPEWALEQLVKRRLMPKRAKNGVMNEESVASEVTGSKFPKRHNNSDASGGESYDNAVLSTRRPGLTVAAVMNFQLLNHEGFIHAFMSSIRHAPIYEQQQDWLALGKLLAARRAEKLPGLMGGKVLLLLGKKDSVIVREELIHDATALLGEEAIEAVSLDCGHEIVMTEGGTLARLAIGFWGDNS